MRTTLFVVNFVKYTVDFVKLYFKSNFQMVNFISFKICM